MNVHGWSEEHAKVIHHFGYSNICCGNVCHFCYLLISWSLSKNDLEIWLICEMDSLHTV